jgi:hypothetical protein
VADDARLALAGETVRRGSRVMVADAVAPVPVAVTVTV